MIMGTDGIPIERLVRQPHANMEAVAAEYTTLLRASVSAAADTGLGDLRELSMVTDQMIALLVGHHARVLPLRRPGSGGLARARPVRPPDWRAWSSRASSSSRRSRRELTRSRRGANNSVLPGEESLL